MDQDRDETGGLIKGVAQIAERDEDHVLEVMCVEFKAENPDEELV